MYPIVGGVPRFVAPSFYSDQEPVDSAVLQTARSYGTFWKTGPNRTLGLSKVEKDTYEPRFLAMLGITDGVELHRVFQDGATCLNAGCGVAWSEYLFNVNSRTTRFGVDLSSSVDVAFANTRTHSNVCIAQADLLQLPFPNDYFDVIFSGGVLHHTANPATSFAQLCNHLKPGGFIGIYVYKVKPFLRELADQQLRAITTRLDFEQCTEFAGQLAALGLALQRYQEPLIIEQDIPLLGIKAGTYNLQKFVYDHFLKCFYNSELGLDHSVLANVDWYHPQHASHHTKDEVASWFESNGIMNWTCREPKGWEHSSLFMSGRKST
jgi:SAM-dependent methyltransferase